MSIKAMEKMEAARFAFADAAVEYMRDRGFDVGIYTDMMAVLGTRNRQDRWATVRGHVWDSDGRFVPAGSHPR